MTDDADELPEWDGDGLGPLVSEHRAGSAAYRAVLAFLAVMAVAGNAFGGAMGLGSAFLVVSVPGQPIIVLVAAAGLGMGVFLSAGPTALFVFAVRRLWCRVLLFEGGVVVIERGRAEVVRWTDVADIWNIPPVARWWPADGVSVRTHAGRSVGLTAMLRDSNALAAAVRRGVLAELLPAALEALAAGGDVAFPVPRLFGRPEGLVASAAGLDDGRELVPWAAVTGVAVVPARLVRDPHRNPHLFVWTAGLRPWFRCPATAFPNVDLFRKLAREFRGK